MLEGALARRAVDAVEAIGEASRTPRLGFLTGDEPVQSAQAVEEASLAGGRAGLATLYAYLAKAGFADRASETSQAFLDQAAEAVGDVNMPPSLYGGFTGVAWTLEHLSDRVGRADDDPNEEIDAALAAYVARSPWTDDYDLVSGLVGLGVYALERLPRPGAGALLSMIVDRLEEASVNTEAGTTWLTRPDLLPEHQRRECPEGYYNLGLAHGVPGVIALLGGACAAGVGGARARPLLDGAVQWLLSQKCSDDGGSLFPRWIAPGNPLRPARSAWCYGDPGIAAALLCAAQAVGDASWEREAHEIARFAAARPPADAGVRGAGLCHGAAGLAHLFNRLFQATGDEGLAEAARFWFTEALNMRQPGRGIAGFAASYPRVEGGVDWIDDPGLLTGAAGIALALTAAVTTVEPDWDRMLLVSLPPAARGHAERRTEP